MKVFISYAREDIETARRIYAFLASIEELSPWFDKENLHPGENWRETIFTAIAESRLFILLLSRLAFARKRFLHEEIAAALRRHTDFPEDQPFIIPVRLDDCDLSGDIARLHTIDLGEDGQFGLEQLRSTVVRALTSNMADAFRPVSKYWSLDERARWIKDYGHFVMQFSATTVLRHLDEKYKVYTDETYAVRLMIEVSHAARSESLTAYVLRLHEIARTAHNYVSETSEACGAFLDTAKLVPANVHGILLRHALDSWLELGAVWGNTFTPCLILLDVAKHYLAQREGRYHGDFAITLECLKVLRRYDLLLIDLLVFYARRTGDCDDLLSAVSLLASHYDVDILERRPQANLREALLLGHVNLQATERVHSFANSPRMPMLLVRIGECFCSSDDVSMGEYGLWLKNVGLEGLRWRRTGSRLIESLNSAASTPVLDALERHDVLALASLLGVDISDATYLIAETMITFCSHIVPGLTYAHFPSIDSRAFRERDPGLIGFRR